MIGSSSDRVAVPVFRGRVRAARRSGRAGNCSGFPELSETGHFGADTVTNARRAGYVAFTLGGSVLSAQTTTSPCLRVMRRDWPCRSGSLRPRRRSETPHRPTRTLAQQDTGNVRHVGAFLSRQPPSQSGRPPPTCVVRTLFVDTCGSSAGIPAFEAPQLVENDITGTNHAVCHGNTQRGRPPTHSTGWLGFTGSPIVALYCGQ